MKDFIYVASYTSSPDFWIFSISNVLLNMVYHAWNATKKYDYQVKKNLCGVHCGVTWLPIDRFVSSDVVIVSK